MRSEIRLLREIHTDPSSFEPAEFVNQIVRDEINHLKTATQHSSLHEYVKKNGYPIPNDILNKSSYIRRPNIETRLKSSINKGRNVILIGCEGSGKTTLVHYVLGTLEENANFVIYIDTSDIEFDSDADVEKAIFTKISTFVSIAITPEIERKYREWLEKVQKDVFLNSMFEISTPQGVSESLITFLRTNKIYENIYIILDNLDSLSVRSNRAVFDTLNRVEQKVEASAKRLNSGDQQNVRYIVCCRTPTYYHVSGPSVGLFLNFPHEDIDVDDDFLSKTDISEILGKFLINESGRAYGMLDKRTFKIGIADYEITTSLPSYLRDAVAWLHTNREIFNRTIKMFCGRSIRRAKLYGLKVISSDVIARIVHLEKFKSINLRLDKDYIKRRLLDAIFDFSSQNTSLYPLNIFRMVRDDGDFRENPLIGISAVFYIFDNREQMSDGKMFFANALQIEALITYLRDLRYSELAILDFFDACRASGLLRPIPSSGVLLADSSSEDRHVYSRYILDDNALTSYVRLLTAEDPKMSMIFFNSAVRAHYHVGGPRRIDNLMVEVFTTLVFVRDFLARESKLQHQIAGTGIMMKTPSSRFQGRLMPLVGGILSEFAPKEGKKEGSLERMIRQECLSLHAAVRTELRQKSGII